MRRRALSGAATLAAGQAGAQAMGLVRNIIVARLIGATEFGIAATLAVTASLIDLVSDLALDKMLIQARDGDDERLQACAHTLQIIRGLVAGAALYLLATPIALIFETPQAIPAYRLLALLPLARGFVHLDFARLQRDLRFRGLIALDVSSQTVALALAWPLGSALGTHAAVLWLILAQAVVYVVASHLIASRAYRLGWNGEIVKRFSHFGWPLLINGLLLWVIMQGDRLIVGTAYSMETLGAYSAAFSLAMLPGIILARVNRNLFLPLLAGVQGDKERFAIRYRLSADFTAMLAAAVGAGFVVGGPALLHLLYGPQFDAAGPVIGWLGLMQAVRVARGTPSVAAVALGDTKNPMIANTVRVALIALAIAAALQGWSIVWVAAAGFIGEVAALAAAARRLKVARGVPTSATFLALLPGAALVGLIGAALLRWPAPFAPIIMVVAGGLAAGVAALAVLLASPRLRLETIGRLTARRAESGAEPGQETLCCESQ